MGPLWELLWKSKCNNWSRQTRLFESLASSVLLYGAETWGYNHGGIIEKLQLSFYKRSLGVAFNAPNYAVRIESGRIHTIATVKADFKNE